MTAIAVLAEQYNQLSHNEPEGLAGITLPAMSLCYYQQSRATSDELLQAISYPEVNGWALTTHRKALLPITLEQDEQLLEAQLWQAKQNTSWHVVRHNQQLIIQRWQLNQGDEQALSYEFSHLSTEQKPLSYRRLINAQGQVFAAVFTGFKESNS
ncbi:hypothetical protein [Vibrio metschnikovii]|uniref:hypothetical protein n=1 Tax=Vibrio metschnikovii TaxID=28172 RepID=UPI001C30D24E|nr:hypothetical protein [Vibrio metschnikovii]